MDQAAVETELARLTRERDDTSRRARELEAALARTDDDRQKQEAAHRWELDTMRSNQDKIKRDVEQARTRANRMQERVKQLEHALERVLYYLDLGRYEQAKNSVVSALEDQQ
jgi:predicted  nucleic acid-binding Zn-ribbon protein